MDPLRNAGGLGTTSNPGLKVIETKYQFFLKRAHDVRKTINFSLNQHIAGLNISNIPYSKAYMLPSYDNRESLH